MKLELVSVNTSSRSGGGIFTYKASCLKDLKNRRKQTVLSLIIGNIFLGTIISILTPFFIYIFIISLIVILGANIGIVELINRYIPVNTDIFYSNFAVDLSRHENRTSL